MWRGILNAWFAVTRDLIDIVLPYRIARVAPLVCGILASLVIYGSLIATIDPNHNCRK